MAGSGSFAPYAEKGGISLFLRRNRPAQSWGTGPKNWGYDYVAINRALEEAFARCAIDRSRLAIGGFSDGASYALSLGLANGDVFGYIIAFSPGFIVRAHARGRSWQQQGRANSAGIYCPRPMEIMSCQLPRRVASGELREEKRIQCKVPRIRRRAGLSAKLPIGDELVDNERSSTPFETRSRSIAGAANSLMLFGLAFHPIKERIEQALRRFTNLEEMKWK